MGFSRVIGACIARRRAESEYSAQNQQAQQQIEAQQRQIEALQQQKQQPQPQPPQEDLHSEVEKICGSQTTRSNNGRRISETQGGLVIKVVSYGLKLDWRLTF